MHKHKNLITNISIIFIVLSVIGTVYFNQKEKSAVDKSKLPQKVEASRGFQRWITNLKNKELEIEADEFQLLEENEIYNTRWITVSSIELPGKQEEYDRRIQEVQDTEKIIFAPSKRLFIDYREIARYGYSPTEVLVYGLRDDKIIESRIVDCSREANCYFDRAYFLDNSNDVFVISEFSRDIDPKATNIAACAMDEQCTYTIKLHVIDLINNSRLVYESKPFDMVFSEFKPEL